MARYSSESDSDYSSKYRRKRNRRSRSSGSNSSDSSSHRRRSSKYSKTKHRHRSNSKSRGRDRNLKSYRGSRSSRSRDRDKRRYRSTGRSHSSDRSKRKARSNSREKSRSPSSSSQSNQAKVNVEKSQVIVAKDDFSIEPRFKESVLDEINAEGFSPKQFNSSSTKDSKFKNIVIDISSDTIQIPPAPNVSSGSESIFHTSIMMDQEARFEKWVKKLYTLRQKAIVDVVQTNVI